MRLLYVSHSFPPPDGPLANVGGMQRVATELYAALRARPGITVVPRLLETSWRWTHIRAPAFLLGLLRDVPGVVRTQGIDVVLFSSMVTAAVAPYLRRRLPGAHPLLAAIPVGRDVTLPAGPYQRHVPRVLDALDLVFPISRATASECMARGAHPDSTHVVPCGADLARFPPVIDRGETRATLLQALGIRAAPDTLLLCSVGRHQERKGFHWFVEQVMPRLPDNTLYLLAGDGPMTERIRAAVHASGLEGRVRLLGQVSEEVLVKLYRGADVFVMPNIPVEGDIEGFGVVMLEAALGGLPVIAADLEGIRDVVREGCNGELVPSGDADGFVAAVQRYVSDRSRLEAASRSAREYTARHFSWSGIADQYLEYFRAVIGDRPAVGASGVP